MSDVNDGDWVTGEVQWWWKYVLPTEDRFWISVLSQKADPTPVPWKQSVAEVLQAVAMLQATGRVTDTALKVRLQQGAAAKLKEAAQKVGAAKS